MGTLILRPALGGLIAVFLAAATPAAAQLAPNQGSPQFVPSTAPGIPSSGRANMLPPGGGVPPVPSQTLAPPAMTPPAPPMTAQAQSPLAPAGQVVLALSARYGRENPQQINGGLVWRVYPARPDQTGAFRPVREDKTATPLLTLPPGDYVVHVSFGLASASKAVRLRSETTREIFDIPAGAIRVEGRVGDARIPAGQISFDVFRGSQFEPGEKRPIAQGVAASDVVVVSEGTYHIVSNYGDSNAVVRSDIRVQAGKLTDVAVSHRAAIITLKLVGERGGEALANTNWLVLTPGGDVIKESIGAFPRVILAEGDYRAIARNEGKTYERDFKVITGVDGEIEVIAR
jgi:hypothetical protein